ncbi:MAG: 2-oxoacid ferredoxin oxidoreductase [delta proteobacterium MLS_D]|jgi:2-oxoglutarate/2-oxoacid ferredoxin oxidoreductase subunit beta|nr:MAG: 2-oxoacid ferredoxin oxidoreductase [delta proteobacterium MLS_D]
MKTGLFDGGDIDIAWCPGCGNYAILEALKKALEEVNIVPEQLVMVSGIGQAAKIPHYMKCNFFNGLHGRALPVATAIKTANPGLMVIAESGEGDMYGEGGNHFLHAIRRNPDITNIVHNNLVYGLTKGQASPTSLRGFVTPVQVAGVNLEPFNPLAVAVAQKATFIARAFAGDHDELKNLLVRAITHRGYALVDILQPCVSFNKLNTFKWFRDHTYYLDESHDSSDRVAAFRRALEDDPLPLGLFYEETGATTFEQTFSLYETSDLPLFRRKRDMAAVRRLAEALR